MKKQVKSCGTSADFVYAELRGRIISRQIECGTRLPEIKVAAQIKVSRTPVREALKHLASEGLVNIIPNSGARVSRPSSAEIMGAFMVREHLEILSVSEAAKNGLDRNTFSRMEQIISREEQALSAGNLQSALDANNEFHTAMAAAADNPVLGEYIRTILLRTELYIFFYHTFSEDCFSSPDRHKEILNAVAAGNGVLAKSLIKNHLRDERSMLTIPDEEQSAAGGGIS